MSSTVLKLLTLLSGGASPAQLYDARVLATSPLRYNKLNETSGTAIVDSSSNAYTGTYTGVTLDNTASPFAPDNAPLWDGVNDYGNIYSAAFATAFNMDEFTILLWFKLANIGVWSDGIVRPMVRLFRNASNEVTLGQRGNGGLNILRIGGGTTSHNQTAVTPTTAWCSLAISASVAGGGLLAAGDMRGYFNGAQIGSTLTGNIASTGSGLGSSNTVIGANSITPVSDHSGWLSRMIIWNRPIDAAILALMTP